MKITYTPEVKAEAIRLYVEEKCSCTEAAAKIGCTGATVAVWLRKAGVERRSGAPPKRVFSKEQIEDIAKMYYEGYAPRIICQKHDIKSYSTFRQVMVDNGYKLDRPKKSYKPEPKLQTLCWKCSNAVGRCSWSQGFVPVEGWTAEETARECNGNIVASYTVLKCPQFIKG